MNLKKTYKNDKIKYILATFLLLTVFLFSFINIPTAYANTSTYYLIKEDTEFIIEDSNLSGIKGSFTICKSWYVESTTQTDKIDGNTTYKIVKYNGVQGKVDKSKLSAKTTTLTTSPFYIPLETKTITQKNTLPFYKQSDMFGIPHESLERNLDFLFIGKSTVNDLYFIKCKEFYGFIESVNSSVEITTLPTNPNMIDPDATNGGGDLVPPNNNNVDETPTNNLLKILLIVAICVLSVLVVFLIFKPTKTKKSNKSKGDYYDEE